VGQSVAYARQPIAASVGVVRCDELFDIPDPFELLRYAATLGYPDLLA
jgi:hypothetical protein